MTSNQEKQAVHFAQLLADGFKCTGVELTCAAVYFDYARERAESLCLGTKIKPRKVMNMGLELLA